MPNLGYNPDAPSYHDPFRVDIPGMFPGQAFGSRNMPAYVASVPTPRDFMARENQYAGNSAFAAPMGFGFSNPLMNFAMQGMVMPAVANMFGMDYRKLTQNLAPIIPPNMPFQDWLAARERFDTFQNPAVKQQILGNAYAWDSLGTYNTLVQDFWDANFNPAGSSMQTAQSIYGRFGALFSGDATQRLDRSMQMYRNLNNTFSSPNAAGESFFDFNKSFGFNRPQIAEMLDVAARRGVGGLSSENIEQMATNPEMFREKASGIAKFMSAAQDIFGRDKGFDELTSLIGKALANFQTVDTQKATDLLQKIQATSRALNISSDAMAEYVAMFNDLDRSMGGAGVGNTMQALRAAEQGSLISSVQREQGGTLTDQNEAMIAAAQMGAGATNSFRGRWSLGFMSSFSRLSDSERAMKANDGRTINEVMDDFKRAWNSGDAKAIMRAQASAERALAGNSVLSAEDIRAGAQHLTRGDRARAESFMEENGFQSAGEALQIGNYRDSISKNIMGRFDKDGKRALFEKAGGMSGLRNIMASMGEEEAKDRAKAADKIYAAAGGKLSRAEAQEYARAFSAQVEQEHREAYKKGRIFTDGGDGEAAFSAVWALGSGRAAEMRRKGIDPRTMDAEVANILGENVKGSIMRGIGIADVLGAIPKNWEPVREKVMEARKARGAKGDDWTMDDWKMFVTEGVNAGLTDITKVDEIAAARSNIAAAQKRIRDQYQKDLDNGIDPRVARQRAIETAKKSQAEITAATRDASAAPAELTEEDQQALAEGRAVLINGRAVPVDPTTGKPTAGVGSPGAGAPKSDGDGKAGPPITADMMNKALTALDRIAANTSQMQIAKTGRENLFGLRDSVASDGYLT